MAEAYQLDDAERHRLRAYLLELGADPERIDRAEQECSLGALAVEVASEGGPGVPYDECVPATGRSPDEVAALWRALGFADPAVARPLLQPDEQRALTVLGSVGTELLGFETTLALARLIGGSTSRLADAIVDAFRSQVEVPGLAAGTSYVDVVRTYSELLQAALPQMQEALGASLRRHLVTAAAGAWTVDDDSATLRRDLVVGFVDLVGWTSYSRSLSPDGTSRLVRRFEDHVAAAAESHDVRVVKLLGDGAMVVGPDATGACRFGVDLVRRIATDGELPPVRIGLAAGPVVALAGDHHGAVVNLAARLAGAAPPGEVLVDGEVRVRASGIAFGAPAPRALPGFPDDVEASAVVNRSSPG